MTYDTFLSALEELGVRNISEFCRITGFYRRTVQRWRQHGLPLPVAHLLRAWLQLQRAGIDWRPNAKHLPAVRRNHDAVVHSRPYTREMA